MEYPALQPQRQAGRQVAEVRPQVQRAELESGVGFSGLGKRRALGGGVKAAAVEREGQVRRGLDVALGAQIA